MWRRMLGGTRGTSGTGPGQQKNKGDSVVAAPRIIDYGRIEPGWREGIKSVQQLCDEYQAATGQSVTPAAARKHFRKLGVPRDLSAKISAKAEAMVSAAMVSNKVSVTCDETLPAESEIISSAATTVANVQLSHRADIRKLRDRARAYEEELDKCADEELAKRVRILKDLKDVTCSLIASEREAYGMDKGSAADDIIETITRRIIRVTG